MLGPREPGVFEVEPENWPAVLTFIAVETQWRYTNAGLPIGINYLSLESVMRMRRVKDRADVFARVQIMEREALRILQKAD